jgi:adenine/guanine phosphoribosyltransferase-like PRPP-binding protein
MGQIVTNYLINVLTPSRHKKKLSTATRIIRASDEKWDAIVCMGNSGTLFAGGLSVRLGLPIILVRKPQENTHSTYLVEGLFSGKQLLFIDDFISSGKTLMTASNMIKDKFGKKCKITHAYFYRSDSLYQVRNGKLQWDVPVADFKK